jgi:hypothetical protein
MILYLIIIFLLIIVFKSNNIIEKMAYIYPNNNISCCLIKKKYIYDETNNDGGNFKYTFDILNNNECNFNINESNDKHQLYISEINNWSNDKCNNKIIGSCRRFNKECIDFVDNDYCKKYSDMVWSNKTCNDPLDFTWKDPVKNHLPNDYIQPTFNGTVNMFS